jgi:hypothetical protein
MIDIAMPVCNRGRITEIVIRELRIRTTTPHRLIVLNNGSDKETSDMLLELKREGLIDSLGFSPTNGGIHYAHNGLLAKVKSSLYVSTDNDLFPAVPDESGDWLARLVDLIGNNQEYAAIACRPHVLIGEGGNLFDGSPEIKERAHVGAHLRIMRTDLVRESGGWSKEIRASRNNEEKWICGALKKLGHKVGYARDIRCIHLFGESDLGEDSWGYKASMKPEDHGHREIWPPAHHFSWDRMGIDWYTCR